MFTEQQLKVIQYCATECEHQASGEPSVYDMVNAWEFALVPKSSDPNFIYRGRVTLDFILSLGALVEPEDNKDGFRTHAVGIRDPNFSGTWGTNIRPIGSNWQDIERHLSILLESYYDQSLPITEGSLHWAGTYRAEPDSLVKSPEDMFYKMYEEIHPFSDGNGRTGKILYNYLCGTLENPIWPPNFFGGEHP